MLIYIDIITINFKYPIPNGLEIIKKNGVEVTLDEILKKKDKIKNIISNSKKYIENEISNENFIHYAIIYESNFYSNIDKPSNIIELFTKLNLIFSSISDKKKIISLNKFKSLKHLKPLEFSKYCKKYKYFNDDSCPICIGKFNKNLVTILPCKHIFHKTCIKKWLIKESNLCPICRKIVT